MFVLCSEKKNDYRVMVGGLNLGLNDPQPQLLLAEKIFVHEQYRETATVVYNDIGDCLQMMVAICFRLFNCNCGNSLGLFKTFILKFLVNCTAEKNGTLTKTLRGKWCM